jgi:hypothetical protein
MTLMSTPRRGAELGLCQDCPAGREAAAFKNTSAKAEATGCEHCEPGFVGLVLPSRCARCPPGLVSDDFGGTACSACPPGFIANREGSSCFACPAGQVPTNATVCGKCPAGTYAALQGADMACAACPENTVSTASRFSCDCAPGYTGTDCSACPIGTFKKTVGVGACHSCAANEMTTRPASTSARHCVCKTGFANATQGTISCEHDPTALIPRPQGHTCFACPERCARCTTDAAGAVRVEPKPNYFAWRLGGARRMYLCPHAGCQCSANATAEEVVSEAALNRTATNRSTGCVFPACTEGYTGVGCGDCVEGWGHRGRECNRCNAAEKTLAAVLVIILLVTLAMVVRVGSYKQAAKTKSRKMSQLLSYVQMLFFVGDFKFKWPRDMAIGFSAAGSATASQLSFFDCVRRSTFHEKVVVLAFVPFVVGGVLVLWTLARRRPRKDAMLGFFVVSTLMHATMCESI